MGRTSSFISGLAVIALCAALVAWSLASDRTPHAWLFAITGLVLVGWLTARTVRREQRLRKLRKRRNLRKGTSGWTVAAASMPSVNGGGCGGGGADGGGGGGCGGGGGE